MAKRIFALLIISFLILEQSGFAQAIPSYPAPRYLSEFQNKEAFRPLHMRAVSYDAAANKVDLLLDPGDVHVNGSAVLQENAKALFNYFRTGLALPNSMFWVNLRPDSDTDIIDPYLERTDMGRILLAADVQLKKDVARFTSPDTKEGREYWDKLYSKAGELFGGEDVEIPTVTRPWIVPGEIIIKQTPNGAYIYKAVMKVCLEQDWLTDNLVGNRHACSLRGSAPISNDPRIAQLNAYSSQLIRELVIPKLTREVNSSKRYSELRRVFYSLILAQWFKQSLAVSGERLAISSDFDNKDLSGLTSRKSWSKQEYYNTYRASFEQGEYNNEEQVRTKDGISIRRYFSGGIVIANPGAVDVFPADSISDTGLHASFDMAGKEFDGGARNIAIERLVGNIKAAIGADKNADVGSLWTELMRRQRLEIEQTIHSVDSGVLLTRDLAFSRITVLRNSGVDSIRNGFGEMQPVADVLKGVLGRDFSARQYLLRSGASEIVVYHTEKGLRQRYLKDGGTSAVRNAAPFPFPVGRYGRGSNDAEWLESYIVAQGILSLIESTGDISIKVSDLVDWVRSESREYNLIPLAMAAKNRADGMSEELVLNRIEGLRQRGLISVGLNDRPVVYGDTLTVRVPVESLEVWSDDYMSIKGKLETVLDSRSSGLVVDLMRTYSGVTESWSMYPAEAQYPVLRAVALLDKGLQERLVSILSENHGQFHSVLSNSVLLMLAYDKEKYNWFKQWAKNLHGRSIYMVSAEASLLAGGLGRVNQYHGKAMMDLGADVFFVEPYYPKMMDQNKNEIDTDYTKLSSPVEGMVRIDHQFFTIVNSERVAFSVYTGKVKGIRTYLIRDDAGEFMNLIYEYDKNIDAKRSQNNVTEFFTKASAEVIRYLEIQKRTKKLKDGEQYVAPVIDANDGQALPILSWIRMFYENPDFMLRENADEDNIAATVDIFRNALLSGTTHTYVNRGHVDKNTGGSILAKAGVPYDWKWLYLRKDEDGRVLYDPSSAGLRSADVAKAVSAIHANEVGMIDPSVTLFGVTNGDDRAYSSEFFRQYLAEAGCVDYEHATPAQVFEAKRIAKIRSGIGLDPDQLVVSYSGRLVPEKAGRQRAFTDWNIEEMVKAGIQVVIFGNVQKVNTESLKISDQLQRLQEYLDRTYPQGAHQKYGRFIFKDRFFIDEQRQLLAASDIQVQDSDRKTGASEYTEANVSACGGLQMGAPFWEGIIQRQGGVLNKKTGRLGNTLVPAKAEPQSYLDAIFWANELFREQIVEGGVLRNGLSTYQAQSIRFSRILEAILTASLYLSLWDKAAAGKTVGWVKPGISGDVFDGTDIALRSPGAGDSYVPERGNYNSFYLKDVPTEFRKDMELSMTIWLNALDEYSNQRVVVQADQIRAEVVNEYGIIIPMSLKQEIRGPDGTVTGAVFAAKIDDRMPLPFSGTIRYSSGLFWKSESVRIYSSSEASAAGKDGGSRDVGGVDFRAMPVVLHKLPAGALDGAPVELRLLDIQWRDIAAMLSKGEIPYDKLKDYAQACRRTSAARMQLRELSKYIEDILKMEENAAVPTSPGMKEIIAFIN